MDSQSTLVRALLGVTFSAVMAVPAEAASLQQVSSWNGGVANLPSDVSMYAYVPDKVATNPPILTLIHSCDSNASVVLGQAPDLKSAADKYGFIMVVPQSNPSSLRCWTTDSTQVWTRDKGGDSNAIKQMVVYALSKYQANADRVYASGCSSGAMMTELLLGLYPDIFKAGSSFAGMPAGCHAPSDNSSNATGYNGSCAGASSSINYTAQQWGDLVRAMDSGYTGHRPRLQLFHGDKDQYINFVNMSWSCDQYINLLNLSTNPTKTNTGLTLGTHQATEQQWNNACGYLVLDAFDSINGDHGPSDTLFVGKYVLPFFGLDSQSAVNAAVDPEIAQCVGDGGAPTGSGGAGGSSGSGGGGGSSGSGGSSAKGGSSGNGGSNASGGSGAKGGSNANGGSSGSSGGSSGGNGGISGSGGSGNGGAQGSGGSRGSGGASGGALSTGGQSETGGSSVAGGSGGAGSGGAAGTGAGGGPGSGGSAAVGDSGSSGCSCALGAAQSSQRAGAKAVLVVGFALWAFARRRRRAGSPNEAGSR